jgi:magnesium transporter
VADAAGSVGEGKKWGASRCWILFDEAGEEQVLDADKYAIMHGVDINARDFRILDPLLSYPSTILGRECAIVLNLEVRPPFAPSASFL